MLMTSIVSGLCALGGLLAADPVEHRFEIDHVFVFTEAEAPESKAFIDAGFILMPRVNEHTDQGTKGSYIYFDNVYIEFLWVSDAEIATANIERANSDFNIRQAWKNSPSVSPFGVGIRDHAYRYELPAKEHDYKADWMGPATDSRLGVFTERDALDQPWVFRMPPHWTREPRMAFPPQMHEQIDHPSDARVLTEIVFAVPGDEIGEGLRALEADGKFTFVTGASEHLVTMTFDDHAQGRTVDFRPEVPIVIEY